MRFSISYEGPRVEEGRMDARKLGRSIASTGVLLERASEARFEGEKQVNAEVNADFDRGSFVVDFTAVAQAAEQLSLLDQETLRFLVDTVFGSEGLVGLLMFLAGRASPDSVEISDGLVNVQIGDEVKRVDMTVLGLAGDERTQEALDGIMDPLRDEGVDGVSIDREGELLQEVEEGEADYFGEPIDPQKEETVRRDIVQIVSPDFRRGNKWELSSAGGGTFYAAIEDDAFWDEVDGHTKTFGKGDALEVDLRTTQAMLGDEVVGREHEITQVHDTLLLGEVDQPDLFEEEG